MTILEIVQPGLERELVELLLPLLSCGSRGYFVVEPPCWEQTIPSTRLRKRL
jgi:hypothetical protein